MMSDILLKAAIIAAIWVVAWVLAERVTGPARALHLTVFNPWRGDGWPIGVQEDDDARFRWNARSVEPAVATATQPARPPSRPARGTFPAPEPVPSASTKTAVAELEDVASGGLEVTVARLDNVHVRGRGH